MIETRTATTDTATAAPGTLPASDPALTPEQRAREALLERRRGYGRKYRLEDPVGTRLATAQRNRAYRERIAEAINARLRRRRAAAKTPPAPPTPTPAEVEAEAAKRKKARAHGRSYDARNREKNAKRMRDLRRRRKEEAARASETDV